MPKADHVFQLANLQNYALEVFSAAGLTRDHAQLVADGLVLANLRGIDSHGVSRIPMYLERLERGVVNPTPKVAVQEVASSVSVVDGDDGMGFIAGDRAMSEALRLAKSAGIGLVGVRRSTHFGMAAIYILQALEQNCISMAFTNSSPAIPVWGGRSTFLGAAPMAAGVPGAETPYVLDMAMTVIARGKIRLAAMHDEPIPEGLALDSEGKPTTDAKAAFEGVCLPFGGVKGSALSMLMDLLCGVMTGANYGGEVKSLYFDHSEPQNVGHMFIAMRPDLFVTQEEFDRRMATFVERAKAQPLAAGFDEIMIPGEPEARVAVQRRRDGIPLSNDIYQQLCDVGSKLGVPPVGT